MSEPTSGATITAIRPLPSDPLRCCVRVGRRTVARLPRERAQQLGLEVGLAWDGPLVERVRAAEAEEAAERRALRILGRRALSRAELVTRLQRSGHEARVAEAVADRLVALGMLDDRAYGRAVIRQVRERKPAGRRLLEQRLRQKGLTGELLRELVDEAVREADPVAEARRLVEQRLRRSGLRRCEPAVRRRRLHGALARRGFDAETIRAAVDGLEGPDEDDLPA